MTDVRRHVVDTVRALPSFTAEQRVEGNRTLLRGRRVRSEHYAGDVFPMVMTVESSYSVERDDGLPTSEQHEFYGEIVFDLLDAIETPALGVHCLADTSAGRVREWFQVVSDIDEVARAVARATPEDFRYEINYDTDPAWSSVDALLTRVHERDPRW